MKLLSKIKTFYNKTTKQYTTSHFELGRSMVEMLGVLSVIGVLTTVGITGYSYAIRQNEANNLAYELQICNNIVSTSYEYGATDTPDFSGCLTGFLNKYTPEISEPFTYEGETTAYYEIKLHDVSDEVVNELIKMKLPFEGAIYVNGKEVVDGKIISFQSWFIKSAYAGGNNEVGIVIVLPTGGVIVPWNDCDGKADGGSYCSGNFVYTCKNGQRENRTYCSPGLQTCSNGECKCLKDSCSGGRTLNQANCNCDCPADKPLWDGSKCKDKDCETASDCVSLFSGADVNCMQCNNGLCSVKPTDTPTHSGYGYCKDGTAYTCNEDGSKGRVEYPCVDGDKCCNGECIDATECCGCTADQCCNNGTCDVEDCAGECGGSHKLVWHDD